MAWHFDIVIVLYDGLQWPFNLPIHLLLNKTPLTGCSYSIYCADWLFQIDLFRFWAMEFQRIRSLGPVSLDLGLP